MQKIVEETKKMTEIYNFGVEAMSCHAWNKDNTGLLDFFFENNFIYYVIDRIVFY